MKDNGIIDRFDARENLRRVYAMDLPELAPNFTPPPAYPTPEITHPGIAAYYPSPLLQGYADDPLMPEEDGTDG